MNDRPNILIIMSDQHSRHVLGSYGNQIVRTPALDRLAAEGMRFRNAYCAAPVCVPSRMSFLSSRTPTRNRVWHNNQILNGETPTWAHVLSIAGYETSLLGRMHFEGHDQYHGFERRPVGELFAIHPGAFPGETYPSGQDRRVMELSGRGTTWYQWMDDQITLAACQYLEEQRQRGSGRPFAAVVGYVLPHCPFIAPPALFDYYHGRVDIPQPDAGDPPAMIGWYRRSRQLDVPLEERRVRIARAAYFALCEYLDRRIGQLLERLQQLGLADNTLVMYCSDHGDLAGEHGLWTKNTYYEGSVGVPLIARLPGLVPAGTVAGEICNLMDIGPTLADLAGAPARPDCDGRSLLPILRGERAPDWPDETYSETVDPRVDPLIPSRMIRSGPWKLWVDQEIPGGPLGVALYNLEQDPGEHQDLSRDPSHADTKARLLAKVRSGWDPDLARREATAGLRDYRLLARWGKTLARNPPELMARPGEDVEQDVEIL